jgi:hypothetical protein
LVDSGLLVAQNVLARILRSGKPNLGEAQIHGARGEVFPSQVVGSPYTGNLIAPIAAALASRGSSPAYMLVMENPKPPVSWPTS